MEPKTVRKQPKMSTVQSPAFTRSVATMLVELEERQSGSRMAAYEAVAKTVGTSASWLRKFIKGHEIKEPGWTTGWNILDQYSRICDRVEAGIETERAKILALKGIIDAANKTTNRMVEGVAGTQASGTNGE